jgi:hypothetical protein
MHVVHLVGLRAVVRITRPDGLIVAVPPHLPTGQVLDLASLILTPDEYAGLMRWYARPRGHGRRLLRRRVRQRRTRRARPIPRTSIGVSTPQRLPRR